jgi:hypothetical protein
VVDGISHVDAVHRGGVAVVGVARVGVALPLRVHGIDGLPRGRVTAAAIGGALLGHRAYLGL